MADLDVGTVMPSVGLRSGIPATPSAVGAANDALHAVRLAGARLREHMGAERVGVWILNEAGTHLSPIVSEAAPDRLPGDVAREWLRTPVEDLPLLHQIVERHEALVIDDVATDPRIPRRMVEDFGATSLRLEPLVADRCVGVLTVEPATCRPTTEVSDLVRILAVSVGQAQARREADRQREQATLLLELSDAQASSRSLAETLGSICERLAQHARMRRACLFLLRNGEIVPTMARYADGHQDLEEWGRFRSAQDSMDLLERVVVTGEPHVIEEKSSPLLTPWWVETFDLGSVIAVPVGVAPNVSGVLTLDTPEARPVSAELVRLVAAAGAHVDAMITRAEADEDRRWNLRTLQAIRELLQAGSQASCVADAGEVVARVALEAFEGDHAVFVRQRHGHVVDLLAVGVDHDAAATLRRELIGTRLDIHTTWRDSLGRQAPLLLEADDPVSPSILRQLTEGRSAVLPLVVDGRPLGVVHVGGPRTRWHMRQATLAEQLSLEARLILENAVLRETQQEQLAELAHQATHDPLTSLPNRVLLEDRLGQALRARRIEGANVGLLFLDLDGFKRVNDRVGHAAADVLLQETARRLRTCLRNEDTVARFAGDEFVVLLPQVDSIDVAEAVAERIHQCLAQPVSVGDQHVFVSVSIGISCGAPGEVDDAWLVRTANAAMFRAKRTGRGRTAHYDPGVDRTLESTLGLEDDLHYALQRNELRLHYQPIVDLSDGRAVGFEALLRWEHPEHGTIPPLDFIPLAESTGQISPIGRWVLSEACRQLAAWRRDHRRDDLFVSVNLSPLQVHDPDLIVHIKHTLDAHRLPPESLLVEITESSLLHEEEGLPLIAELRRLGIRIAIDDFGTGYSALSYLQRFPVDVLKVDKSFVSRLGQGADEGALARTVVAIARTLGVTAIAEGIEQPEQLTELRELGSPLGQGYHFAAPLCSLDAAKWLRQASADAATPTGK